MELIGVIGMIGYPVAPVVRERDAWPCFVLAPNSETANHAPSSTILLHCLEALKQERTLPTFDDSISTQFQMRSKFQLYQKESHK